MDHWDPALTDGFAHDREVILFNNAGISSSSGEVPTSIEEMAQHAAAFTDTLGIEKLDALGFSMGGLIAQQFSIGRPTLGRLSSWHGSHQEWPPDAELLRDEAAHRESKSVEFLNARVSVKAAGVLRISSIEVGTSPLELEIPALLNKITSRSWANPSVNAGSQWSMVPVKCMKKSSGCRSLRQSDGMRSGCGGLNELGRCGQVRVFIHKKSRLEFDLI